MANSCYDSVYLGRLLSTSERQRQKIAGENGSSIVDVYTEYGTRVFPCLLAEMFLPDEAACTALMCKNMDSSNGLGGLACWPSPY